VVELLEQGDDVNCRGAQMRTPLHRAVGKGHNSCVEVLIKHNADLNLVDGGGLTPLHWAALFGLVETGKLLVNANPDSAATKADLNICTKAGETPLHLCAEKGKVEFVKFLLQAGAKTDIKDKSMNGGLTPYDAAKKAGQKEVMILLQPESPKGCCTIM
jgi:ankyrin repeat protein